MDLNRHQFFFLGVLLLFVGLQVRMVSAYVLNENTTQFLTERASGQSSISAAAQSAGATSNKVLEPPEWLGWCLISVGAVCVLHSLAMPRPD